MNFIDGIWVPGNGGELVSTSPIDEQTVWQGAEADEQQVQQAFHKAAIAQTQWAKRTPEQRYKIVEAFAALASEQRETLGAVICCETGKPLKESIGEVDAVAAKCKLSHTAMMERQSDQTHELGNRRGHVQFRPLGVVSVFGPFNFPMHIANGQIVPAILAGNSVVFKPSELTPHCAEMMVRLWQQAGLPDGVLNLVQGGVSTGQAILGCPELRGLYFTGSHTTGKVLRHALAERLEVLLALELGGNNALVVRGDYCVDSAVDLVIPSAYQTSGQRCTCTRRLVVPDDPTQLMERLIQQTREIQVQNPLDCPDTMMGPLIHSRAVDQVLSEQNRLSDSGGEVLVEARRLEQGPCYVSPGIVDVTDCNRRTDDELFGPLLQIIRVKDLDAAISEVNRTKFGLAAGIICNERNDFLRFREDVNSGLINWNLPTTGASGRLPFGGLGHSGNYRPAGYFAIDFCSVPVAQLEPAPKDEGA